MSGRVEGGVGDAEADLLAFHVAAGLRRRRDHVDPPRRMDRVAPGLRPVGGADAGEEEDEHRRPQCPPVGLLLHHPPEGPGQPGGDHEDAEHRTGSWSSGVGFSNGCAELALKKPPPLVPSCLIASWLATGPMAIVCLAPSSVWTSRYGRKFWIDALLHEQQCEDERERQEDVERAAHEVGPEVAEPAGATAARCPGPARPPPPRPPRPTRSCGSASWVIWEKYDIVVSPEYDCQLVFVVNDAAVSNAWRSTTAGSFCGIERQDVLQPQHDVGEQHRGER